MQGDRRGDNHFTARQPAQAHERALAGRDRAGGGRQQVGETQAPTRFRQGVGQLEAPGDVEFRGQTLAVIGRCRDQGAVGEVDRPALAGRRPLHTGLLSDRGVQIDEPRVDHQALAIDDLGVIGDRHILDRSDGLDDPAPDDDGAMIDRLARGRHDLRVSNRIGDRIDAGAQARPIVGRYRRPRRRQEQSRDAQQSDQDAQSARGQARSL